jgi:hypothetical protein
VVGIVAGGFPTRVGASSRQRIAIGLLFASHSS